jgi:perosamine synthetase
MIPHSKPLLGKNEEAAASRVIRSGLVAQGAECAALESELAAYLSVEDVIVVSSGSAALHLGLLALILDTGKDPAQTRIGLPSYVCTALLNAIRHVGCEPHLIDLPPSGYNIIPDNATTSLDGLIVPHMFGQAATGLESPGCPVIEDCAMAIGAASGGRKLGSIGRLGVFSFYATKVLCAGEGGAVCTSDPGIAGRIRDLRDYDGRNDSAPRFNYKMTDIQAAIAREQLRALPGFISRRRELALRYSVAFEDLAITLPDFTEEDLAFRYVIQHDKITASSLIPMLERHGISARAPVFQPLHRVMKMDDASMPNTSRTQDKAVSLPLYPALTDGEADQVIAAARAVL